jgi:hypothetical protein
MTKRIFWSFLAPLLFGGSLLWLGGVDFTDIQRGFPLAYASLVYAYVSGAAYFGPWWSGA